MLETSVGYVSVEKTHHKIKELSQSNADVPENCFSRLMYFLDSVDTCMPDLEIPREYLGRGSHTFLSDEDKVAIIAIAEILSPDVLENHVFFQVDDDDLDDSSNKFFEITMAKQYLGGIAASGGSIVIAGETKEVIIL